MAAVVCTLPISDSTVSSIFDNDDDPRDDADQELHRDEHYEAPTAGRELGAQSVPLFDVYKLRPFELMFVDNKEYDFEIRGGANLHRLQNTVQTQSRPDLEGKQRKRIRSDSFHNWSAQTGLPMSRPIRRLWLDVTRQDHGYQNGYRPCIHSTSPAAPKRGR